MGQRAPGRDRLVGQGSDYAAATSHGPKVLSTPDLNLGGGPASNLRDFGSISNTLGEKVSENVNIHHAFQIASRGWNRVLTCTDLLSS